MCADFGTKFMKRIAIYICVLAGMEILSGCNQQSNQSQNTAHTDDHSQDITTQGIQWDYDGGTGPAGITGTVINQSKNIYNVSLHFNLYASGTQIDDISVSVENLEAGKSWHFAQALSDYQRQATDFKLMTIDKYQQN